MIERALSSHLLKLVTGVDISTRAVNSSGRPGNDVKRRSRTAAAAPNSVAFLLSMLILRLESRSRCEARLFRDEGWRQPRERSQVLSLLVGI